MWSGCPWQTWTGRPGKTTRWSSRPRTWGGSWGGSLAPPLSTSHSVTSTTTRPCLTRVSVACPLRRDSPMMLHLLHWPSSFFLNPHHLPLIAPLLLQLRELNTPQTWRRPPQFNELLVGLASVLVAASLWHTHCSALCPSSSVHFWSSSPWTFTPWPPPPHPPVTPCCLFDYPHFGSSHYDLPEVGGCRAVRRHLFLIGGWLRS